MKRLFINTLFFLTCSLPLCGQMYIGAAYYPEHVDKEQVEKDARLMQEAHFNVARMGDFAWHSMEPKDGMFTLEWLDHAVRTLSQHGIQSLLCTPTAAIPKWMHDAHPDIMMVEANGTRKPYGRRRHACLNNEVYRQYCVRIARTLAERYKDNPSVIGFQIDNEPATEDPYCYCPECLKKFKRWLQNKYQTIEALNQAWGTIFWSETLDDFEQVWLPHRMDSPCIYLDYQRFNSDMALEFIALQRDAVKAVAPNMTITTNIGGSGFVTTMDLYRLSDACDVLSFDNYPVNVTLESLYGNEQGLPFDPAMTSFAMQIVRGGKSRPIWVPEAQIGRTALTQKEIVKPGFPRLWNHQQLAYGCRLSVFFPFRAFPSGHEQLMAGVVESDNVKRAKFYELQQTAAEIQEVYTRTGELLPTARAAIIRDFQTDWTFQNGYTFCPDLKYLREVYNYYHALRTRGVMADIVSSQADLTKYKLIVVPYLAIASPDFCRRLEEAASRGAVVLLTCVSGVRDIHLHKEDAPVATVLQRLAGIEVEGQEALFGRKAGSLTYDGLTGECRFWFDQLRPTTARLLASFSGNYFAGNAAIMCNNYGKGRVYYVATVPAQSIIDHLTEEAIAASSIKPMARCSHPQVELTELADVSGNRYLYAINFSDEAQTVSVNTLVTDIRTRKQCPASFTVKAMDYMIMQVSK